MTRRQPSSRDKESLAATANLGPSHGSGSAGSECGEPGRERLAPGLDTPQLPIGGFPKQGRVADDTAPMLYRLEDQIGFVLRRAHQRATEVFNTVMAGFDVTPMQFAVLVKLHDLGPTSQNQLGRLVAMDPATMFGVAGRLIKRGFLEQSPDPSDARLVLLGLTLRGRRVVEAMRQRGLEVSRRTLEPLEPGEAELLRRLLAKIA